MKTFTQLVGTTAINSDTLYPGSFTSLAQNNSAANVALGKELVSDQHRYLIQKYFNNERTFTITTVGGQTLALTATPAVGATTGTLTATWSYPSYQQLVVFSSGEMRTVQFQNNSTAISWTSGLTNTNTTVLTTQGVQDYNIPAHISKIKNDTITVGQLKYQPIFVKTQQEWDSINMLPYKSDIPNYCYIYNGKLSFFPIPATTGNVITFSHKARVPNFSFADYSTGTLAASGMTVGSVAVTGLSTSWSSTGGYPLNTDISQYNLFLRADPPYGDGIWYPIYKFLTDTTLVLGLPVISAPNILASTTYTIGQLPLLDEDFHDMIVYGALLTYFSTLVKDKEKYEMFKELYKEKHALLDDYAGTKSVNVDLESEPQQINPNLFIYAQS